MTNRTFKNKCRTLCTAFIFYFTMRDYFARSKPPPYSLFAISHSISAADVKLTAIK